MSPNSVVRIRECEMVKKYNQTPHSQFTSEFKGILANRSDPETLDVDTRPHLIILGTGGVVDIPHLHPVMGPIPILPPKPDVKLPTLLIIGPGVASFQRLIALLEFTEGIGEYLDQDFLEDRVLQELQYLALEPPDDDAAWTERVKRFLKSLRGLEEPCKVYLPVVNLNISTDITVGKVNFRRQGFEREELVRPIDKIFAGKKNPPEEKRQFAQAIGQLLQAYKQSPCSAEVNLAGHDSKATDLAYEIAREAINLFRCYIPVLFGTDTDHRIGLFDDTTPVLVPGVVMKERGGFHIDSEIRGSTLEYEVEEKTLNFLRTRGAFDYLSAVLGKSPRNELESALSTAIWWIGTGNHLGTPSQQAVALATGLEAILIPPNMEEKTEPLANHAAHLLASTADERQKLYKKMKELYGVRSEVVHKGRLDIPIASLVDLKYYSLVLLVEIAKRAESGWTKVQNLVDAVRRAEFGGDPVSKDPHLIPRGPIRPTRKGRATSHGTGHPFMMYP